MIASDNVNEGDVFLLEEGIYFQTVNISKNSIRITAKGSRVIFDGKGTKATAFLVTNDYRNCFVGENYIVCNDREGIIDNGDFGMFQNNEISYNGDIGITLNTFSVGNLVMDNKLVCNIQKNINYNGTGNNLINNIDKPCRPCESPSDVCDNCAE